MEEHQVGFTTLNCLNETAKIPEYILNCTLLNMVSLTMQTSDLQRSPYLYVWLLEFLNSIQHG